MNEHVKCTLRKAKQIRGMLAPVIGYYSKVNVETKYVIIQACLLPVLDYGIVQLLPRISRTNLLAIERQYRMALKAAGGFPRSIPTEMLWDITDDDPWHIRVNDLHHDMVGRQVKRAQHPGARRRRTSLHPIRATQPAAV